MLDSILFPSLGCETIQTCSAWASRIDHLLNSINCTLRTMLKCRNGLLLSTKQRRRLPVRYACPLPKKYLGRYDWLSFRSTRRAAWNCSCKSIADSHSLLTLIFAVLHTSCWNRSSSGWGQRICVVYHKWIAESTPCCVRDQKDWRMAC